MEIDLKPVIVYVKYDYETLAEGGKLWNAESTGPEEGSSGYLVVKSVEKVGYPKGCELDGDDWRVPSLMRGKTKSGEQVSVQLALEVDPPVPRGKWKINISSMLNEQDGDCEALQTYPAQEDSDKVSHFIVPVRNVKDGKTITRATANWNNALGMQYLHIHPPEEQAEQARTVRLFRFDPEMDREDYQRILNKIALLELDLMKALDKERSASVGERRWEYLKDLVGKMQDILRRIEDMPERELVGGQDRVPAYRVKKLTPRAIMDQAAGKRKLLAGVHEETSNIYEHRMIRAHLEYWKKLTDQYRQLEEDRRRDLAGEDLADLMRPKGSGDDAVFYRESLEEKARARELILTQKRCNWEEISQQIDQMLSLSLLRDAVPRDVEHLHTSNLFAGHHKYHQAYSLMRDDPIMFTDIIPWDSGTHQVGPANRMYELWCLLKMLCIWVNDYSFTLVEPSLDELRQQLRDHFRKKEDQAQKGKRRKKKGDQEETVTIHLKKENGVLAGMEVWLAYEKKLKFDLCPDYYLTISYGDGKKNREYRFCLDAKYRSYAEDQQTETEWYVDLFDVAWYKYIHLLGKEQGERIDGSYILHSDSRSGETSQGLNMGRYFWSKCQEEETKRLLDSWIEHSMRAKKLINGRVRKDPDKPREKLKEELQEELKDELEKLEGCRIGAFCFTPLSDDRPDASFRRLVQMIMEHFVGREFPEAFRKCWICGEEIKGSEEGKGSEKRFTRRGNEKFRFACDHCKEFWVQTLCNTCGRALGKHPLNYYRQKGSRWFSVVCPDCGP